MQRPPKRGSAVSRADADALDRGGSGPDAPSASVRPAIDRSSFDEILALAKNGHHSAFEQLFVTLNRPLHAFCLARGATDAEGTVNEVFLKVFRNVDDFDGGEDRFRNWAFTIARNHLIDESRRAKRRPVETVMAEHHEWVGGDVETEAIDQIGDEWLHEQLSLLTDDQRDVLLLRIVSDLTVEATAEVMGKEPGAVKALQRRALRTLHRHVADGPAPL